MSNIKQKIKNETTIGTFLSIPSSDITEILSLSGFDWLIIDMEHAPISIDKAQSMIQTISDEVISIMRPTWNDPVLIKQCLDIGAQGLLIPWINNVEDAENAIKATKYPPQGIRGVGPRRASKYGKKYREYLENANDEIFLILQIETREAVENIDDILKTEGVDLFFIGPADLSTSMGYRGVVDTPEVVEIIDYLLDKSKELGVPAGIYVSDIENAILHIKKGFKFIALSIDYNYLLESTSNAVNNIKSSI